MRDWLSPELVGALVGGSIAFAIAALSHVFAWLQLKSTRAFDLRQSVYLEAAGALAEGLEFFSKVARLDIEDSELHDLVQPMTKAMFKIHVVGTPSTIAALSQANQCLTSAAVDLGRRRAQLKAAIAANFQVPHSGARVDVGQLQKELLLEGMRASMQYQRHLVEVNISARRELELPVDESQYRAANLEAEKRITAAIEQAVAQSAEQPT
jgi:hypothetical protein